DRPRRPARTRRRRAAEAALSRLRRRPTRCASPGLLRRDEDADACALLDWERGHAYAVRRDLRARVRRVLREVLKLLRPYRRIRRERVAVAVREAVFGPEQVAAARVPGELGRDPAVVAVGRQPAYAVRREVQVIEV